MDKLPEPEHKFGYPESQIKMILKELEIDEKDFNKSLGINTVTLDGETGDTIYYVCDVERALYVLGYKFGKNYEWD